MVDNGSPAEARTALEGMAEGHRHIMLRLLPENLGPAVGWNRGVEAARDAGFAWVATFDKETHVVEDFAQQVAAASAQLTARKMSA